MYVCLFISHTCVGVCVSECMFACIGGAGLLAHEQSPGDAERRLTYEVIMQAPCHTNQKRLKSLAGELKRSFTAHVSHVKGSGTGDGGRGVWAPWRFEERIHAHLLAFVNGNTMLSAHRCTDVLLRQGG